MPPGFEYQGESDSDKPIPYRIARWVTPDKDLDALRDQLVKVGQAAGYQVTVLEKANGLSHYDVEFLKGTRVFQLSIFGLVNTMVNGHAIPTIQFKTTAPTASEVVLPVTILEDQGMPVTMINRTVTIEDMRKTSEAWSSDPLKYASLKINGLLPSPQCTTCRFAVSIKITAFRGSGDYSAAEVQINPGEDTTTGDYGNPTNCSIVVKDEFHGSFECHGLKNKADPTKTIDLSGSWQAPLP